MNPNTNNFNPVKDTYVKSDKWPGAFGIFKLSKAAISLNIGAIIGLWVILCLLYIIVFGIDSKSAHHSSGYLVIIIFNLLATIITTSLTWTAIQGVRGKKISVSNALSAIFSKLGNIILVVVITDLLMFISIIAFVIPGFFIIPRIYMSIYFVLDQDMGAIEAIKASWHATEGNVGKVYGIIGVALLMILPIITVIGILATVYFEIMYFAASAILYTFITSNKQQVISSPIDNTPATPIV
jgi:uncharacterized membrane protein